MNYEDITLAKIRNNCRVVNDVRPISSKKEE
jgi:hypothetical protein